MGVNAKRFVAPSLAAAVVAALALFQLGAKSLWLDEGTSVFVARMDWHSLWDYAIHHEPNLGAYYLLLHVWLVIGDSEWVLRSLSVVAAIGTVPLVYVIGESLFGRRVAVLASLFFSVNAFVIAHAQEARPYALVVLLSTVSSYLFIRAMSEPSTNLYWILYVLTGTLAVYVHVFAGFVLFAHMCSLVFLRREDVPLRSLMWVYGAVGVLTLPLLILLWRSGSDRISWLQRPTIRYVIGEFADAVGGVVGGGRPLLLLYFVACGLALWPAARAWKSAGVGLESWRFGFVLAWLLIPVVLSLAISLVQPLFLARYLIVCVPAVALVASIGVANVRRQWLQVALVIALVVLAGRGLVFWYEHDKEGWREAAASVLAGARRDDAIIFYHPDIVMPFGYYVLRTDGGSRRWPDAIYPAIDWNEKPSATTLQGPNDLRQLSANRFPRVWLVLSHDQDDATEIRERRLILEALESSYEKVSQERFIGIDVILYQSGS
jgi:mannosyltransferase